MKLAARERGIHLIIIQTRQTKFKSRMMMVNLGECEKQCKYGLLNSEHNRIL
jgi:hypothetical protein